MTEFKDTATAIQEKGVKGETRVERVREGGRPIIAATFMSDHQAIPEGHFQRDGLVKDAQICQGQDPCRTVEGMPWRTLEYKTECLLVYMTTQTRPEDIGAHGKEPDTKDGILYKSIDVTFPE